MRLQWLLQLSPACSCASCQHGCRFGSGVLCDDDIPRLASYLKISEHDLKKKLKKKINDSYIGIQIKPEDIGTNLQVFAKYKEFLKEQHIKFTEKYKGKCFVIFSVKKNDSKVIQNKEVVDEIKKEIQRLKNGEK